VTVGGDLGAGFVLVEDAAQLAGDLRAGLSGQVLAAALTVPVTQVDDRTPPPSPSW